MGKLVYILIKGTWSDEQAACMEAACCVFALQTDNTLLGVKLHLKKCAHTQNSQKSWNIVVSYGVFSLAVVECFILFLYPAYFQRTIGENVESLVQLQYGNQRRRSFYTLEPKVLNSKITCGFAVKHYRLVHCSCRVAWNFDKARWLCKEKYSFEQRRKHENHKPAQLLQINSNQVQVAHAPSEFIQMFTALDS